jgi:glutaredoxin-related protein
MARPLLDEAHVHPSIRDKIGRGKVEIVAEVERAIAEHDVVVVGMTQNPHPKQAREALKRQGIAFHYLGYGSYFGEWRPRLLLKMWSGWPTFPMVFVKGTLVGGASEVVLLIESGEMGRLLAAPRV